MRGRDLCTRICARLNAEATVLAPQHRRRTETPGQFASAAAASVAAAVFVAFVGVTTLRSLQQHLPQLAAIPATEVEQAAVPAGDGAKD